MHNILVIGDAMLDDYSYIQNVKQNPENLNGNVYRVLKKKFQLGAAAAVAYLVKSMGEEVHICSVSNVDNFGSIIQRLLVENEIFGHIKGLDYSTTIKTRYIIDNSYLYPDRFDYEFPSLISRDLEDLFLAEAKQAKVVLVSDYGKGVCTDRLMKKLECTDGGIIIVDPCYDRPWKDYLRADIIKANLKEAKREIERIGIRCGHDEYAEVLSKHYRRSIVVTAGDDGIYYYDLQNKGGHIEGKKVECVDVCGAGDTVLASLGCSFLIYQQTLYTACVRANEEAALQIRNIGIQGVSCERTQN